MEQKKNMRVNEEKRGMSEKKNKWKKRRGINEKKNFFFWK